MICSFITLSLSIAGISPSKQTDNTTYKHKTQESRLSSYEMS